MNFWEYLDRHWVVGAIVIVIAACTVYEFSVNISRAIIALCNRKETK